MALTEYPQNKKKVSFSLFCRKTFAMDEQVPILGEFNENHKDLMKQELYRIRGCQTWKSRMVVWKILNTEFSFVCFKVQKLKWLKVETLEHLSALIEWPCKIIFLFF